MQTIDAQRHAAEIIEQFSRQALPFTQMAGHFDAIELLIEMAQLDANDKVLDVACGPGLVACEFARHAGEVHGVDLTAAMIEQATRRQREFGLDNLRFQVGDATPLNFRDAEFDVVLTRYSFHHFLEPQKALAEMIRVCRPGGRVLVADVAVPSDISSAFDRMERLRDSSHTHALTCEEFDTLFARSGLEDRRYATYEVNVELEQQLAASHLSAEAANLLRQMTVDDIGKNALGVRARHENGIVKFSYPIRVWVGRKG